MSAVDARRCAGADERGDCSRWSIGRRSSSERRVELTATSSRNAVGAAEEDVSRGPGGEGGAPDLGLGLRGRGQGQQRGGGQQGQAGPRAGAVRSLPGLATAPGSRKSPCPGGDDARF